MKKILVIMAIGIFSTAYSQENKNEQKETVVTKTTTKDNSGEHVDTKAVITTETQEYTLDPRDAGKTDQDIIMSPVEIKTEVAYSYEGKNYQFKNEKQGYRIVNYLDGTPTDYAILRPTSQRGYYIMSMGSHSAYGYFNERGDFITESYDPTTDSVVTKIYKLSAEVKTKE